MIDNAVMQLNNEQLQAINHREGPLVVYAGAGSGKTMVITYRIARLLETGVPASSILAVTFTNKAAKEMKERLNSLVGPRARSMLVATFHSACARFLRIFARELGFTETFSIFDDNDKISLLKNVIKDLDPLAKFLTPQVLKSKIDQMKNAGIRPEDLLIHFQAQSEMLRGENLRRFGDTEHIEVIQKCYEHYQKRLRESNALDFNDLLLETVRLLRDHPAVLAQLQGRFKYFLVDEFQDTNPIQFEFIRLLSSQTKNLCIVGDDDQSIYSWRGADPSFILDFQSHFPSANIVKLENNYRSTRTVVDASAALISHNLRRAPKTLRTDADTGSLIALRKASDPHDEARIICDEILSYLDQGSRLSDAAILYRTNAQSRALEDHLRRRMLPYVIYGSVRFYERSEIKVVLAYLRLLVNPDDDMSFLKIVNTPRRGLGAKALQGLTEAAREHETTLLRTAIAVARHEWVAAIGRGLPGLIRFATSYETWLAQIRSNTPISQLLETILSDIELDTHLRNSYPEDFDERWLNIMELRTALFEFEARMRSPQTDAESSDTLTDDDPRSTNSITILTRFLEQAQLVIEPVTGDDGTRKETQAVSMMTIHSAKGLEFKHVFLAGLEEGCLPHVRSLDDPAAIEEERRLLYVAMTRARETLHLSWSNIDVYESRRKSKSRFLYEIPEEFIDSPLPTSSYEKGELRYVPIEW